MKNKMAVLLVFSSIFTSIGLPSVADARSYYGRHHYYHYRCKRSSGTTGLVLGGAGGALLGHALGGGTVGTILGAGGGALLGRHLDQRHDAAQNYRNGC